MRELSTPFTPKSSLTNQHRLWRTNAAKERPTQARVMDPAGGLELMCVSLLQHHYHHALVCEELNPCRRLSSFERLSLL